MYIPNVFEKIINKTRYSTDPSKSTLVASDIYFDGHNSDRHGRSRELYRTKKGNWFVVTYSMWQGETTTLEPITQEDAIAYYEGPLSTHELDYQTAFPTITIEDA